MTDHGARHHAEWSASATDRNWNCKGSLALTEILPEKESFAAAWGTAAHQIADKALRNFSDAADYIGTAEKTKTIEIEVDDEIADTAQIYMDYVRKQAKAAADEGDGSMFWIEQNFNLDAINPPFQAGGTCDAMIYFPVSQLLEVGDLKGGRGVVVEAVGNPQLRTYALGAVLAHPELKIRQVRVTIIQPRAGHPAGRIRSETFHVMDLMEWASDLKAAMLESKAAKEDYARIAKGEISLVGWQTKWLSAGDHCKFCRARGFCPALEQLAMDKVGLWFDEHDEPRMANAPSMLDPPHLAQILDVADLVEDWLNGVRAFALAQAELGVEIPNYVLVDKIARRKWLNEETVARDLTNLGVPASDVFNMKLKSPNQIDQFLGSKRKASIAHLYHAPVTGQNLVRADKTTRKAVKPAVDKFFQTYE